jgi:hypothetical protein
MKRNRVKRFNIFLKAKYSHYESILHSQKYKKSITVPYFKRVTVPIFLIGLPFKSIALIM